MVQASHASRPDELSRTGCVTEAVHVPALAFTVMSTGQSTAGAWSMIVTRNEHISDVLVPSVAEPVTVCTPTGHMVPGVWDHVNVGLLTQLSTALLLNVTSASHSPAGVAKNRSSGQAKAGGIVSITVTVKSHCATLVPSVVLMCTTVDPVGNRVPDGCDQVRAGLEAQLSEADVMK